VQAKDSPQPFKPPIGDELPPRNHTHSRLTPFSLVASLVEFNNLTGTFPTNISETVQRVDSGFRIVMA
jgi:hypothetical protein